jgi:hypothetical protein
VKRVVEMFDVESEMAVRIAWPDDDSEAQVSFMGDTGSGCSTIPASVVQLAASVAANPSVLTMQDATCLEIV